MAVVRTLLPLATTLAERQSNDALEKKTSKNEIVEKLAWKFRLEPVREFTTVFPRRNAASMSQLATRRTAIPVASSKLLAGKAP